MPYGRSSVGGPTAAVSPNASSGPFGGLSGGSKSSGFLGLGPTIILVGILILYFTWSLVERHERVRDAVQPKAVALNLRNLAAIMLPVLLGIPLLKVAAAKYKAIGGPGGDSIVVYLGAL